VRGRTLGLAAVISGQLALPLMLAASLMSANAFGGTPGSMQDNDVAAIADFFDGLRAWELKEHPTAVAIWLRAAEWGDVRSMEKIGELYEQGEVLPHDTTLAYFWLSQAAQSGVASAKAAADRLRNQLPADHLSEVDASVASWQPKSLATAPASERKPDVGDLLAALNNRDIQRFRTVLSSGVSANSLDLSGVPAIFLAVAVKQIDFVKALLEQQADPNITLPNGMTPLHLAAGLGDIEIVRALLSKGSSGALEDSSGASALDLADRMNFSEIAVVLRIAWYSDTRVLRDFLDQRGYVDADFDDPVGRRTAVKMFQKGRSGLEPTGNIDLKTLQAARDKSGVKTHYLVVYTFMDSKNRFSYRSEDKTFLTSSSGAMSDIGQPVLEFCRPLALAHCRFQFVPSGGCLAVAKPKERGPYKISRPNLTLKEASTDALAQCAADTSKGCEIVLERCVDAQ